MPWTSKIKISHPWAKVSLQSRERTRFLPLDAFYSQPWSIDSGSYQLAEKAIIIITITIVISPSGCVKAWGRFIVRLPPLRRQMRPSPVRSGSNRPSRSQASHFQSLSKAGLQIRWQTLISSFRQVQPHWNLKSNVSICRHKYCEMNICISFNHEPKIFHIRKEVSNMALFAFNIYLH